jgi:hypothetical protein
MVILSAREEDLTEIAKIATAHDVQAERLGKVGGSRLRIGTAIDESVRELFEIYSSALPNALEEVEV